VGKDEFDRLGEGAAALPRLYGYAPKTETLYPTESARKAGREALFKKLDKDSNGFITLDEWVTYALSHIAEKSQQLPKDVLSGTRFG